MQALGRASRFFCQLGVFVVCVIAALFFDSMVVSALWLSAAIGLAVFWEIRDRREQNGLVAGSVVKSPVTSTQLYFPRLTGLFTVVFASQACFSTAKAGID